MLHEEEEGTEPSALLVILSWGCTNSLKGVSIGSISWSTSRLKPSSFSASSNRGWEGAGPLPVFWQSFLNSMSVWALLAFSWHSASFEALDLACCQVISVPASLEKIRAVATKTSWHSCFEVRCLLIFHILPSILRVPAQKLKSENTKLVWIHVHEKSKPLCVYTHI